MQNVWAIGMLSQGHMGAPLYRYTGQVGPRFWGSGSPVEWKWCHYVMFEADIHLKPLHTSILSIYKVFEPMVCCLKGMWVHPYTVTPAKLAPALGIRVTWGMRMMQCNGWGWYPPQTASYIHIRDIKNVWVIVMLFQGRAPLYHYIGQVGPRLGDSGSLVEQKSCHNLMVEADIHLRPLHASILYIYKVFQLLVGCLKGIWVHPYTTPAKLAPDLGTQGHL